MEKRNRLRKEGGTDKSDKTLVRTKMNVDQDGNEHTFEDFFVAWNTSEDRRHYVPLSSFLIKFMTMFTVIVTLSCVIFSVFVCTCLNVFISLVSIELTAPRNMTSSRSTNATITC